MVQELFLHSEVRRRHARLGRPRRHLEPQARALRCRQRGLLLLGPGAPARRASGEQLRRKAAVLAICDLVCLWRQRGRTASQAADATSTLSTR